MKEKGWAENSGNAIFRIGVLLLFYSEIQIPNSKECKNKENFPKVIKLEKNFQCLQKHHPR